MTKKQLINDICSYSKNRNPFSLALLALSLERKTVQELETIWREKALAFFWGNLKKK